MTPKPFRLEVPDSAIADLKTRLALTRFPDAAPGEPWAFGASVDYVRDLVAYWKDKFDWRAEEAALNAFPQFKVPLHDIDVHYLHVPGKGPNPYPLLLLHGWPGSVFEFLDIIPRLTDPAKFGGDAKDAFTVIAPSLPGYGLSFKPGQKRFILQDITACVHDLMTQALGIKKFAVQGGDWGAGDFLAARPQLSEFAERHPHQPDVRRTRSRGDPDAGRSALWRTARALAEGGDRLSADPGHQAADAGVRADRFAGWACGLDRRKNSAAGRIATACRRTRSRATACWRNISLYWFTGAIGSSFWPYYGRLHTPWPVSPKNPITVPTGYAAFPKEILRPPRSLAEKTYTDIRRWTEMTKGGHFAAMEQPDALAARDPRVLPAAEVKH